MFLDNFLQIKPPPYNLKNRSRIVGVVLGTVVSVAVTRLRGESYVATGH